MSNTIGIVRPCWLIATGDQDHLEVMRSPLVHKGHPMNQQVREHIADHGLVLASRETFPDTDFMRGEVEVSVYLTPTARNAAYAEAVVLA